MNQTAPIRSAGCKKDHQHVEGGSGKRCTDFVFSAGICKEPMECELSHDMTYHNHKHVLY